MKITLISTAITPSDQGIRLLSSLLKKHKHETQMIFLPYSEDYNELYNESILRQILEKCKGSDLVGVSAYASTAPRAEQVIRHLKKLNIPLVYGGIHATISPDKCIQHCDIVCIGEGEDALLELVKKIEKKQNITKIKNFWIKKENKIFKNLVRPLREKLDNLPPADYDIEDHWVLEKGKLIRFQERHLGGYIFFLTGRGCPYGCAYCSNHFLNQLYKGKGKPLRWHSPDYIIKNILALKNKYPSLDVFDIRDDTFSLRPLPQIKEFCEKYKEKVNLRFKCLADPKTITEEKIKLLIDAGCTDIIVGIQGCERVNKEIYFRNQTDEGVRNAARILNKYSQMTVMYDVITCNPYETNNDVLALINLLQQLPPPFFLSVNNLVFFTGTQLYYKAKKDGIIKTERDSAANLNYWDRFKHIKLKRKNEYLTLTLNLMRGVVTQKRFGFMPRWLLRILIKNKNIEFNNKHKLPTYFAGAIVQVFDLFRESILKPIYRNYLPVNFKVWYDKVRYKV